MKKKILVILPILCFVIVSCTANVHTVGSGARSGEAESAHQWYALGLVPLNEVDTNAMAGGADNYEIKTSMEPIDIVVGALTGQLISGRTVTVTK